jgi:signal transduction histidine kinase
MRFIWVFGATGSNIFSENNFSIAMLLHVIILCITLAAKYLQLEKSLMQAKDMALESIQQSERRLETLVQQRTTDLDDANRKLADQLQVSHSHASALEKIRDRISTALEDEKRASLEQKRFLRMVAHEFRTPLSVIQMASSIIRADPRTPDVHATTNCDRIEIACERMASLINQALREDKLDSSIWRKNAAFIPAVEILQAGVSYGEMISAGRHPISFRCEDELIIQGDHDLLITMINNIVDNAVKYSPAGSAIQVEAISSPTGGTTIRVHDKGRGMSPEEVKQVLQKYFRAAGTQDIPGMGLGLYLVDQISRLHNATISVESAKGQGTTFVLTFPEASADKEEKS